MAPGSSDLRAAGALYLFHLLVGCCFVVYLSVANGWGGWRLCVLIAAFHAAVHAGPWAAILLGSGVLSRVAPMARFLPGIVFVLQLSLWLADAASNRSWGANVTDDLAWDVISRVADYGKVVPGWAWPLGAAASVAVAAAHGWMFRSAIAGAGSFASACLSRLRVEPRLAAAAVATGAVYSVLLLWILWSPAFRSQFFWHREPTVAFFLLSRANKLSMESRPYLAMTPRRLRAAEEDARLRVAGPRRAASGRNVVLLVADSLRADRMGVYGYSRDTTPFLSRLAAEGRLSKVESARSSCNATYCGVLSTLTSRRLDDLGAGLLKIQDLLHDHGYATHFYMSGNHKTWYGFLDLTRTGVDQFVDGSIAAGYATNEDRVVLDALERLPAADGRPHFIYLHLMTSHLFGVHPLDQLAWLPSNGHWGFGESPEAGSNSYDNAVRMTDAIVERAVSILSTKGYLGDALWMVTADHGEALGEHGQHHHGQTLYEEELRVPILLSGARAAAIQDASQLDIAPTIAEYVGLAPPASWQGRSLLHPRESAPTVHDHAFRPLRAVVFPDGPRTWKLIDGPAPELYELRADPREVRNLADTPDGPARIERLRAYSSGSIR